MNALASTSTPKQDHPLTEIDWLSTPPLSGDEWEIHCKKRLQAAERLREALSGVPFYAKGAAKTVELGGNEMDYWLLLQSSEATLQRP